MAAPLALAGAAEKAAKAVSQDLVVIGGQWFHRHTIGKGKNKQEILTPISYELHINPVSIGLGMMTAAIGFVGAWFAWNGIHVGVPTIGDVTVIPGFKDTATGVDFQRRLEARRLGGTYDPKTGVTTIPSQLSCDEIQALYDQAKAARNYTDQRRYAIAARNKGCTLKR